MGAEPRKYGLRSVFDTLVVHTVNDGCRRSSATHTQSTPPGKQPQGRGPKEIGGSLLKRWGMWFNSTIHGAPYQPQWWPTPRLTGGRGSATQRRCMAVVSSCCEAWPWVAKRTQPTRGWVANCPALRRALDVPGSELRLPATHPPATPPARSRPRSRTGGSVAALGVRPVVVWLWRPGAWRKSSQYGLYRLGHTRATRALTTGRIGEGRSDPPT